MIRIPHPTPESTTTEADLRAEAGVHGLPVTVADGWLYVVRTPLLGRPVVLKARCEVAS